MRIKNKEWRHGSVIALFESFHRKASPEEIIIKKAKEKVKYALKYGWDGPPFDPFRLASIIGIKAEPALLDSICDAMIFNK